MVMPQLYILVVYLKKFEGLGKSVVTICETRRQFSVQPCTCSQHGNLPMSLLLLAV